MQDTGISEIGNIMQKWRETPLSDWGMIIGLNADLCDIVFDIINRAANTW